VKKENTDFTKAEAFIASMLNEKLPATLIYHCKEHTFDVLDIAMKIARAENLSPEEIKLLRIAVLFHDAGFVHVYKNHEEKSCEMAKEFLPDFGFTQKQIGLICEMILATKVPQNPMSLMDQIIVDADLDYLGREDVFEIASKLFEELKLRNLIESEADWIPYQVEFLKKHTFFTEYSKKTRGPNKDLYLRRLMDKLRP
jgi:HD superfamily phosphodiesterase